MSEVGRDGLAGLRSVGRGLGVAAVLLLIMGLTQEDSEHARQVEGSARGECRKGSRYSGREVLHRAVRRMSVKSK